VAIGLAFRRRAGRTLINRIGCYVLCDLDEVPIYVGQSIDGIRARVNRHLTSARSDIIANRQVDSGRLSGSGRIRSKIERTSARSNMLSFTSFILDPL
jgi:hypothetical protein